MGVRDLRRFLGLGLARRAASIEVGLHPGLASAAAEDSSSDAWHDPLAALRPAEHRWLVDEGLPGQLLGRGVALGRIG